ncbi:MAG: heavy metal translocating P-type ATPase, partial [Anaerococcus sp.]|nr:heavy metal translocating P-type ATPase [Anaerococcus sp.]
MKKRYDVTGMTCASCQANVTRAVEKLGVNDVNVNLINESMSVDYDEDKLSDDDIIHAVEKIGYGASLKDKEKSATADKPKEKDQEESNTKFRLKVSLVFLIPLLYIAMGPMIGLPVPTFIQGREGSINNAFIQFILTIPVLVVNRKFFINGFKGLFNKAPNMDTLVALGASAATLYGIFAIMRMAYGFGFKQPEIIDQYMHNLYFESAAMILTLITLGKYFEARSKGQTKASLENLINLAPKKATILVDGKEKSVDVSEIEKGDIILIRPGDSIPVDGEIIEGSSLLDEAALTGESIPVEKMQNDNVIGSTMNKNGAITVEATKVGKDTALASIVKVVEEAQGSKAPIQRLADIISGYFVPIVVGIAIFTFIIWISLVQPGQFEPALVAAIAVLVIACPCALG